MNTAEIIISKFGGQQKLADALGIRQSNVSYWASVGTIPGKWHSKIIEASAALDSPISPSDLLSIPAISEGDNSGDKTIKTSKLPPPRVLKHGNLTIGAEKIPCAVLSNGKRVVFQREIVGLLTGNKKGGLSRYLRAGNLQPFVPEKFKNREISDAVIEFPYNGSMAHGFEGTDLIEICWMYLHAKAADKKVLLKSQMDLARKSEIIVKAFSKLGIVAAIDEATGFDKEKDEYQKLLSQYIAEELQPWIKTFGENYYFQIYRLKGWDWSRFSLARKNHPWEVANITNRIIYEKLPTGVLDKLRELCPKNQSGNRLSRLFQGLKPNSGYVHLVKHMGHIEAIMEKHPDGAWPDAQYEIDTRFPSKRDPYFQTEMRLMDNNLQNQIPE